uniref:Uncharacterized protein n=1 Tax=Glossina austeni TaxID=7395 RepID=A0A1A9UDG8_GLOAU
MLFPITSRQTLQEIKSKFEAYVTPKVVRSLFQEKEFQTCEGTQQAQKRAAEIQNEQAPIRLNICINVKTLTVIDVEKIIQFIVHDSQARLPNQVGFSENATYKRIEYHFFDVTDKNKKMLYVPMR